MLATRRQFTAGLPHPRLLNFGLKTFITFLNFAQPQVPNKEKPSQPANKRDNKDAESIRLSLAKPSEVASRAG